MYNKPWSKQLKAFRNNYLAAIIAVAALFLSSISFGQTLDTTRVRQGIYANPGYDYIGLSASKTLRPPQDSTSKLAARDSGAIAVVNGVLCIWRGNHYDPYGKATQLTDSSFKVGEDTITIRGTGGGAPSGPAGGDLSGTYPNPTVGNNAISSAKLRQSTGLSVIGNATNATANVADITAGSDNQVLRRSGAAIGFGAVNLASSNAVTGVLPLGNVDTSSTNHVTTTSDLNDFAAANVFIMGRNLRAITGPPDTIATKDTLISATTATNENSTKVATTEWVKLQGYGTGSGSAAGSTGDIQFKGSDGTFKSAPGSYFKWDSTNRRLEIGNPSVHNNMIELDSGYINANTGGYKIDDGYMIRMVGGTETRINEASFSGDMRWYTDGVSRMILDNTVFQVTPPIDVATTYRVGGVDVLKDLGTELQMGAGAFWKKIRIVNNGSTVAYIDTARWGFSNTAPTATVHISARSQGLYGAGLKLDSFPLLTNTEKYAIENDGSHLYYTDRTGTRLQLDQQAGALSGSGTSGRVAFWNGGSSLTGDANYLFSTSNNGTVSIGTTNTQGHFNLGGNKDLTATGMQAYWATATYTDQTTASSGTSSSFGINYIAGPTIAAANTSVTFPSIQTLLVDPPTEGTHATITDKWAIMTGANGNVRIQGITRLDDNLIAGAAYQTRVTNVTTSGTLGTNVQIVKLDASLGGFTVTLPSAGSSSVWNGTLNTGIVYKFIRVDNSGNTITISAAGGENINGSSSFTISGQYTVKEITATGATAWLITQP